MSNSVTGHLATSSEQKEIVEVAKSMRGAALGRGYPPERYMSAMLYELASFAVFHGLDNAGIERMIAGLHHNINQIRGIEAVVREDMRKGPK